MDKILKDISIVATSYDKMIGRSVVKIQFQGNLYYGDAWLCSEDKDVESSFVGHNIALARAKKALFEDYKNKVQKELKYYQNLINHCRCYKDWEEESNCSKILKKQIKLKEKEVNEVKKEIETLKAEIKYLGSERLDKTREIMRKKREKNRNKAK